MVASQVVSAKCTVLGTRLTSDTTFCRHQSTKRTHALLSEKWVGKTLVNSDYE